MIKYYKVTSIVGDYAVLTSEEGGEVNISVFLLPNEINIGDTLASEYCQYSIVNKE